MAISDNGTRDQYSASASQTVFAYTFEVFVKEDLAVEQNGTLLSEGTHYTVSDVGNDAGGNVTLVTGATLGDIITLYRSMAFERLSDYQQNGEFLANEVNSDLDRLWAALQQNQTNLGASIRPAIDDSILNSSNTELANVATRGGKALGFASDGTLDYKSFGTAGGSFIDASTTGTMTGLSGLSVGDVVQTAEFSTGNGGGGTYDVVLTSSVTPNAHDIIIGVSDPLISFVLRVGNGVSSKQLGLVVDLPGLFLLDDSISKTEHDGGCTIDPTVPFYTLGDEASVNLWYNGDPTHTTNGVFVKIIKDTVTDEDYSVINSSSYIYNEAFVNRKAYETMLRNTTYNDFTFTPKDNPVFIWGSVNPLRNDMTIRHSSGCDIRGRYSDPAESGTGQSGHMFGFVQYANPPPTGSDFTVTGTTTNVNYILDGVASTIFDAGHSQLHNNNVIGFFETEDCSVTGTGGITASDHNGVAFDGQCVNPKVDLAYIKNYDDRAVTMKGTAGLKDSCSVNIGTLTGATLDGTVGESIIIQDFTYGSVVVGTAILNATASGNFVRSLKSDKVDIQCGYLKDSQFIASLEEAGEVHIHDTIYNNVEFLVRRGGTSPAPTDQKVVSLKRVRCESTTNGVIYLSQVAQGLWDEFRVVDCDFSDATGTLTPYSGFATLSAPALFNFKNNLPPKGDEGVHDGAGNAAVLTDTTQSWTTNEHVGEVLKNTVDGSETIVTANTATTITGVLAGGKENDWDVGDGYTVGAAWVTDSRIFNEHVDRPNQAVASTIFVYDTAGAKNDNPYTEITIICTHTSSTVRIPIVMNLRDLFLTSTDHRQSAVADDGSIIEITTTRTGTVVTFTLTVSSGSGTIVNYSKSN